MEQTNKLKEAFTKAELIKILDEIGGDGHGIYDLKRFAEAVGMNKNRFGMFEWHYASDPSDFKHVIFNPQGVPVLAMDGIYSLDMLRLLYRWSGIDSKEWMPTGRGFLARWYTEKLRKFAETMS